MTLVSKPQRILALCLASLLTAFGCKTASVPGQQQGGTVALSADGHLFVAASDNDGVLVFDTKNLSTAPTFIATGSRPERVIVRGLNAFVANRQSRTVTQIDVASQSIVRTIAVGAEPMGMDVTSGGLLLVANAMSGTVQAVDISSGTTQWTTSVGEQIHTLAVLPDGRVYVPAYKSGLVHVLDGTTGVETGTPFSFAPPTTNAETDRQMTQVEAILVSPDSRVYIPHGTAANEALATADPTAPAVTVAYYAAPPPASGPTGSGQLTNAPAAPGMSTITYQNNYLLTGAATAGDAPPSTITGSKTPIAGPRAAAISSDGAYLFLVNTYSNNVAVFSTSSNPLQADATGTGQGNVAIIQVGNGPDGIALGADGTTAYVYNSFDHSLSVLSSAGGSGITVVQTLSNLAPQTLSASAQHGRLLFNAANDSRLSLQSFGGIACASCHPDGRDDGHTWNFIEGARNTPALVGRHLELTAPYHWDGQLTSPAMFDEVVRTRMGGTGLADSDYADIFTYLEGEPGPDNPNRSADGTLTAQQALGESIFEGKAACASCHTAAIATDNKFWNVESSFTSVPLSVASTGVVPLSAIGPQLPNTPSLLGVFASAPYLHDGSRATLEDRIENNPGDAHGLTSQLSPTEVAALVAYLDTL